MIVGSKIGKVEVLESTSQVYLDHENIIEATQRMGYVVDYSKILMDLKKEDTVTHAIAFSGWYHFKKKFGDQKTLLYEAGFHTDQVYPEGKYNKNLADNYLVAEASFNSFEESRFRRFVLIANDGGYLRLLKKLKLKGIFITLLGTDECSSRLMVICDEFIDLNNYRIKI